MRKELRDKYIYASVFIAAFFLPLKTSLSNVGLILLLGTALLSFFGKGVRGSLFKKKSFYFLSPLILYVPLIIGFFYSPLKMEALEELEKFLFLGLVPITLGLGKNLDYRKILKWAIYGIIIGSLISAAILLSIDIYRMSSGPFTMFFIFSPFHTNMGFVAPLGIHPIYLGSYYLMALAFLLIEKVSFKKWLKIIAYVIIFIGLVFLNSRIIYFCTFLILMIVMMDRLPWQSFALLVTALLIAFVVAFPYLKKSYVYEKAVSGTMWDLTKNVGTYNTDKKFASDSRMSRWLVSWELIKERPFFGAGTGTENEMLNKKYQQYDMKISLEQGFDAHNQFLGFIIRFGLWSGVLVIVFFVGNFYAAFRYKDLAFLGFLIMTGSIFLIEDYLDRNMGINFIALFGTLFFLNTYQNRGQAKNHPDLK